MNPVDPTPVLGSAPCPSWIPTYIRRFEKRVRFQVRTPRSCSSIRYRRTFLAGAKFRTKIRYLVGECDGIPLRQLENSLQYICIERSNWSRGVECTLPKLCFNWLVYRNCVVLKTIEIVDLHGEFPNVWLYCPFYISSLYSPNILNYTIAARCNTCIFLPDSRVRKLFRTCFTSV